MSTAQIDIGTCLKTGVERVKDNPVYAIGGFLVTAVVGMIPFGLLMGPMMVGYLRGFEKGKEAAIGDVFDGLKNNLVQALLLGIIGGLLVSIAFMLLVIPGLIVAPMLMLGFVHMAKNPTAGFQDCLMKGKDLVLANLPMAVICTIVFGLVGGIGSVLFGIGALITYPIAMGAWVTCYGQLTSSEPAAPAADVDAASEPAAGAPA